MATVSALAGLELSVRNASSPAPSTCYSDRLCPASRTLERVRPLLGKFGITRVARVTGLDRVGIPVWTAMRPNAKSLSIHQGKGVSDDDARASATMEAIERSVAENITDPPAPESMSSFDRKGVRYDALENLIAAKQKPLDREEEVSWLSCRDVLAERQVMVPLDVVAIDRTRATRYWQSSDGLASGNSYEEAFLHGILERVERDADTIWSLENKAARLASRFDPVALEDPVVNMLTAMIGAAGLTIALFDMTTDIGIPVVSALLGPADGSQLRYIDVAGGCGCHPIAARAAIRAITEAAQSRITLISGARDDVDPRCYADPLSPVLAEELMSPPLKSPPFDASFSKGTAGQLLSGTLGAVASLTNRIFVANLMPDEEDIAVVKVLVPDLEHPEGARRQRYGMRALGKLTVF